MHVGRGDSGRPAALNRRLNYPLIRLAIRANILLLQGHYWQEVKIHSFTKHTFLTPPTLSFYWNLRAQCYVVLCLSRLTSNGDAQNTPVIRVRGPGLLPLFPPAFSPVSRITPITHVNTLSIQRARHRSATNSVWGRSTIKETMLPSGGMEERARARETSSDNIFYCVLHLVISIFYSKY